jgi:hypothetical protein
MILIKRLLRAKPLRPVSEMLGLSIPDQFLDREGLMRLRATREVATFLAQLASLLQVQDLLLDRQILILDL